MEHRAAAGLVKVWLNSVAWRQFGGTRVVAGRVAMGETARRVSIRRGRDFDLHQDRSSFTFKHHIFFLAVYQLLLDHEYQGIMPFQKSYSEANGFSKVSHGICYNVNGHCLWANVLFVVVYRIVHHGSVHIATPMVFKRQSQNQPFQFPKLRNVNLTNSNIKMHKTTVNQKPRTQSPKLQNQRYHQISNRKI